MESWTWLLEQVPVVVVMGVVIIYLYKYIQKKDKAILAKDETLVEMSSEVLKVATLWEIRSIQNTKEHELLLTSVEELKALATRLQIEYAKPG